MHPRSQSCWVGQRGLYLSLPHIPKPAYFRHIGRSTLWWVLACTATQSNVSVRLGLYSFPNSKEDTALGNWMWFWGELRLWKLEVQILTLWLHSCEPQANHQVSSAKQEKCPLACRITNHVCILIMEIYIYISARSKTSALAIMSISIRKVKKVEKKSKKGECTNLLLRTFLGALTWYLCLDTIGQAWSYDHA